MKKIITVILLLIITSTLAMPLFSSDNTYESYQKTEFPKWALDLRRAECILLGGLPIAYPVSALALNLFKQEATFTKTLSIACGLTAAIALVDYILGVINEN